MEIDVCFIDDEVDYIASCEILFPVIFDRKYHIWCATSREEAIKRAKEQQNPLVICMDLNLERGLTGADLLKEIRRHLERADHIVPDYTIFVSGVRDIDGKKKAYEAGGHAYLTKPVDPEELKLCIEAVATPHLEKEVEQARLKALLKVQATHDALTGLLNEAGFTEHARQVLHEAHRNNTPTALIYLDADKFKAINDTLGHAFGDIVIKGMGECIRDHTMHKIRRTDVIARLHGDEFVILMVGATEEQARPHALELEEAISALEFTAPNGATVKVRASAGVASLTPGESDLTKLLALGDAAMYARKNDGH